MNYMLQDNKGNDEIIIYYEDPFLFVNIIIDVDFHGSDSSDK